jgi:RNA polymerase sigma factor (sigma-70 family)
MISAEPVVFVVDDDLTIRKLVAGWLGSAGFQVRLFASAEEFLREYQSTAVGCIVLDVDLPGLDGLALQQRLVTEQISLPIVFVTGMGDVPISVQAMKSGAVDFLTKPLDEDALLDAVRSALERSRRIWLECQELTSLRQCFEALTPRETEVLRLVVAGMLNKQVAAELGIAEKTVKVHRARVMSKLKAQSLAELVRWYEKAGLSKTAATGTYSE